MLAGFELGVAQVRPQVLVPLVLVGSPAPPPNLGWPAPCPGPVAPRRAT